MAALEIPVVRVELSSLRRRDRRVRSASWHWRCTLGKWGGPGVALTPAGGRTRRMHDADRATWQTALRAPSTPQRYLGFRRIRNLLVSSVTQLVWQGEDHVRSPGPDDAMGATLLRGRPSSTTMTMFACPACSSGRDGGRGNRNRWPLMGSTASSSSSTVAQTWSSAILRCPRWAASNSRVGCDRIPGSADTIDRHDGAASDRRPGHLERGLRWPRSTWHWRCIRGVARGAVAVCCSSASFVSLNSRPLSMGDHRLGGEGLQERDLLVGKWYCFRPRDADRPNQVALPKHRHRHHAPK